MKMTVTIHAILDCFRLEATSNRDLGDKFEYLIFAYLRTDPQYAELFKRVWLWMDYPLRERVAIEKGSATVLFLVPSISLLSQNLREWSAEAIALF
jgi:predicted helicase